MVKCYLRTNASYKHYISLYHAVYALLLQISFCRNLRWVKNILKKKTIWVIIFTFSMSALRGFVLPTVPAPPLRQLRCWAPLAAAPVATARHLRVSSSVPALPLRQLPASWPHVRPLARGPCPAPAGLVWSPAEVAWPQHCSPPLGLPNFKQARKSQSVRRRRSSRRMDY